LSRAAFALSDPMGQFTARDGTARVVYRGTDNHVHELHLGAQGWADADLTVLSSSSATMVSLEDGPLTSGHPLGAL